MPRRLAAVLLALPLWLGAVPALAEDGAAVAPAPPATEADCLAAGGRWARGGLSPAPLCFLPTPDAGKACRRAGDCTGPCLAETRSCAPEIPVFGCYAMLDEDGYEVMICAD